MPKKNYVEIKGVTSEAEPPEYRPYGKDGVDHIANAHQLQDGTWEYDVYRFSSKADYSIFRAING